MYKYFEQPHQEIIYPFKLLFISLSLSLSPNIYIYIYIYMYIRKVYLYVYKGITNDNAKFKTNIIKITYM